jgi:hypothetical protein
MDDIFKSNKNKQSNNRFFQCSQQIIRRILCHILGIRLIIHRFRLESFQMSRIHGTSFQ